MVKLNRLHWYLLLTINILFLVVGQSAAIILGRYYYEQGGKSKWLSTLIQTAAFPILCIPLLFTTPSPSPSTTPTLHLCLTYLLLGILISADNLLYSVGLLYISASTYSLLCSSQLAFNAILSYFINSQRFTCLILNSVVVLSLSSALVSVNEDSSQPSGVSEGRYAFGMAATLSASALYSLILCMMRLAFERMSRRETFSVVLEMQVCTSLVATVVSGAGLLGSGEWRGLRREMAGFHGGGEVGYVMTVVWTAVSWQVCSVGVVSLIFIVSSLFSNVISTFSLALVPIAAIVVMGDGFNGVKVIAMLMAAWGFFCYCYQAYLDDCEGRRAEVSVQNHSSCP